MEEPIRIAEGQTRLPECCYARASRRSSVRAFAPSPCWSSYASTRVDSSRKYSRCTVVRRRTANLPHRSAASSYAAQLRNGASAHSPHNPAIVDGSSNFVRAAVRDMVKGDFSKCPYRIPRGSESPEGQVQLSGRKSTEMPSAAPPRERGTPAAVRNHGRFQSTRRAERQNPRPQGIQRFDVAVGVPRSRGGAAHCSAPQAQRLSGMTQDKAPQCAPFAHSSAKAPPAAINSAGEPCSMIRP